jgi:hypothetical protein
MAIEQSFSIYPYGSARDINQIQIPCSKNHLQDVYNVFGKQVQVSMACLNQCFDDIQRNLIVSEREVFNSIRHRQTHSRTVNVEPDTLLFAAFSNVSLHFLLDKSAYFGEFCGPRASIESQVAEFG